MIKESSHTLPNTDATMKIFKDVCWWEWRTLIAAHWYGRNGDFYSPSVCSCVESTAYDTWVVFDFPWHDDGKTQISFEHSIERLQSVIEECRELFWDNNVIWWHSFWAFIASFLASELWVEYQGIEHMILSSLPYSMNNQKLTWLARNTIWKRSHEDFLKWWPIQRLDSKWKVVDGNVKIWSITINDWPQYVREFSSFPQFSEIDSIKVPTTIVRARVDFILWVCSILKDSHIQYFWKPQEVKGFREVDSKFENARHAVIPWWWHGLKVPKTHWANGVNWPSQTKALMKIIQEV